MSAELWADQRGRVCCEYGEINRSMCGSDFYGELRGAGPLIIVGPIEQEARNLGSFGVKVTSDANCLKIEARNGTWVWRLEPAHWRGDTPPDDEWHSEVLLGRWPD